MICYERKEKDHTRLVETMFFGARHCFQSTFGSNCVGTAAAESYGRCFRRNCIHPPKDVGCSSELTACVEQVSC